ncbi:MAG: hypothetical protein ACM3PW_08460 [Chlamydiota bacterium]|jgi:hypothetical protein
MKMITAFRIAALAALTLLVFVGNSAAAQASPDSTQTTELYKLQAAFHRAATVHDPVNGDSESEVLQRIRDMLSLWTGNGELYVHGFGSIDGYYVGTGDPEDPSTCPQVSGMAGGVRGTLCTYFTYVAGPFQQANRFVSLAPSYKTSFDVHGDTASGYFECHFYDVSTTPWTAKVKIKVIAALQKINGQWLFSYLDTAPTGIPVP